MMSFYTAIRVSTGGGSYMQSVLMRIFCHYVYGFLFTCASGVGYQIYKISHWVIIAKKKGCQATKLRPVWPFFFRSKEISYK